MVRHLQIFVLSVLIGLVPLASAEEHSPAELEKVRLQLKWVHQFQFAGYYAAVEKGFYRDAGLEVELIEGKPGVDFVEEVISGNAEYGTEVPYLAIERNNEKPIVVLAAIFQHSPHVLLLRADSGIETPQQLSGKRVMIRVDSTASVMAMFADEGVPLEKIELQEHSWNLDDLIDGKTDAIAAYITDGPFILEEKGIAWKVIKPISYGIDFYGDCLFTSEGQIHENPKQVKAFRQASLKGWEYAMANVEEMVELIHGKYASHKTVAALRNEAKEMEKLIFPGLVEMGHMNPGRWEHIADTFVDLGMMDADYSLDGFIYDPDQKTDFRYLWVGLGVVAGVLFSGGFGVMLTRHLRRLVADRTKELNESRKRYRAIVQDQTELICRNLPDCTLTFVNDAYCKYFGKDHKELLGTSFLQFLPEDQRSIVVDGLKSLGRDNPVKEWQHQVVLPSGELAHTSWTNRAIFDENGSLVEFQGAGRDVTEQVIAQEKLLASEQQLKATNQQLLANDQQLRAANQQLYLTQESVDNAAFEVCWITEDARFSYVNNMACSALGFSQQELLELSVPDVDLEFNREIWDKHWQELKARGIFTFETIHVRKDKSTYPVEVTVNYLEYEGVGYNFAYASDITDRKKAEVERDELMRSIEAKNSELQGVVYTVSHDLKSPLVNIKGFSGVLSEATDSLRQLLKDDISYEDFKAALLKHLDEGIHESVCFIESSTDKMKLLLDGLLAVSRVGTSEIQIEKLNVSKYLQEILKAMQFQIDENHVEITIGDLPDCMGDAVQISSVFSNLIDNAMKYRSLDRKCSIDISGRIENGKAVYCITDNGVGIPENHQPKIFDLFHRLNPNDGVEGQGIGLTIIKRILQRQNGSVRVESVPEKGAKFYVELPIG